jgi:hypothetical protein
MVKNSINEPYKRPINIYWSVVAGPRDLSILQDHDLILSDYDLKIRQIDPKVFHEKRLEEEKRQNELRGN